MMGSGCEIFLFFYLQIMVKILNFMYINSTAIRYYWPYFPFVFKMATFLMLENKSRLQYLIRQMMFESGEGLEQLEWECPEGIKKIPNPRDTGSFHTVWKSILINFFTYFNKISQF